MKLKKVHISAFQSINDSNEFDVSDVTCLVGKNEAGKTAVLRALYRLNPILKSDRGYNITLDYPRRGVDSDLETDRKYTNVVKAVYELEQDDIRAVEDIYGESCLMENTLILSIDYSGALFPSMKVNQKEAINFLLKANLQDIPLHVGDEISEQEGLEGMIAVLDATQEPTSVIHELNDSLKKLLDGELENIIYEEILSPRIPKFLYFDEYFQMRGQDNLDALKGRIEQDNLEGPDLPLIGLINLAGLEVDELISLKNTEELIANLESAGNRLTDRIIGYWSQNRHLQLQFVVARALPEDPPGMTSGVNILGRVYDSKHRVTTNLGTRSRGFIWFFSFLAWYSYLRKKEENIILLLDEPGLSLHAKAQEDLLRYFDKELRPHHQLIYSTHSPFMVDPVRFDRIRIVQDLSLEEENLPENQQGTKVITEVLDATSDSLFPLQGALGYEISQTLFIGPNCLIVEGVSDLLYIQSISSLLQETGKDGLSRDWTITPVGGSDKVPTFVALIGAQTDLNLAVLIDYQRNDRQKIEDLYKRKLLKKKNVHTYVDYLQGPEADIEDMLSPEFYLRLVNESFGSSISTSELSFTHPRIIRRLEKYLENNPFPDGAVFNHYRPARYFSENLGSLMDKLNNQTLDRFQNIFSALNGLL